MARMPGGPKLIAEVRRLTSITPEALGRKLGVPAQRVRAWEDGAKIPAEHAGSLRAFLAHARGSHEPGGRGGLGGLAKSGPEVETGVFEADSLAFVSGLPDASIDLILSDIPYGIGQADWDVLHANRNTAYLGQSAAQREAGKVFAKRRKPINGWSAADRAIPAEYQRWCATWAGEWLRVLKPGGSAMVFAGRRLAHRCVVALEDAGFNYRDMIAWERPRAVFRAQRLSTVFQKRGELGAARRWAGWRVGNLRPVFEPILWFFKPYKTTIADNVLDHGLGAFHLDAFEAAFGGPDNLVRAGFRPDEAGLHEAQKPVDLLRGLIELCCPEGGVVLDPFAGSGSTGVAAQELGRRWILVERDPQLVVDIRARMAPPTPGPDHG